MRIHVVDLVHIGINRGRPSCRPAGRGVTVNAVAPGFVRTEMTAAMSEDALKQGVSTVPMGRMAEPEEIAEAVCFLAGDRAAYITGTVLSVNGGLYM